MKITLGFIFLLALPCFAAVPDKAISLWGTKFSWIGNDKSVAQLVEKEISTVKSQSRAYDPDCFYLPKDKTCDKNPNEKLTEDLSQFAQKLSEETNGSFSVNRERDGKKFRDFGGIAQGYVMDRIRETVKTGWAGNFSGDIYLSPALNQKKPLQIDDPEVRGLQYAEVMMSSGWLLGSTPARFGSKIVDPKTGKPVLSSEFNKIVLFAKPEFSGARLDAWSTALIIGGKELLNKLWVMKEYEGQWAYLFIDANDKPLCSSNLKCSLLNKSGLRSVVVPW